MIGCISTNLEVVPTDSGQEPVYSGLRLCIDSHVKFGCFIQMYLLIRLFVLRCIC